MNSAARDEGGGGGGGVGGEGQSTETETIATEARGHMKKGAKGHGKKARGASAAGQAKSQHPPPEFAKEIRAWAERIQKRIEKRKFKLKLDFSAFKKLFRRRKKKKNAAKADQSTFATQTADGGASTGEDLESREERRHAMELFEKLLRDLMKGMSMEDLRYTSTGSLCSRRFSGDTLKSNPGVATLQRDAATSSGSVSTPGSQQSTMSRAMDPRSMQRAALTYLLMKLSHETNSNGGMSDSTEAIGDARAAELSQSALGVKANDDLERWCWEFLRSEGDVLDSSESDDGSEDECGTSGDASCLSGGTGKLSATGNEDQNLRRHSCSDVAGLKLTKMKGKQHLTHYREEELKSSGQSKFLTLESSALRDPVDGTGIAGHSNCTANGQEVDAHRISSEKINESANEQNNHSGVQSRHESTFNVIVETRGHESDAFVPPVAGPAHAGENKLDGCRSPNGSENSEGALSETESVASSTVTSEERRWEAGVSAVQQGEERFGPPSGSRPGLYAKTEPLCRLTGEAAHSSRTSEESESEESLFSDHGEQSSAAVAQEALELRRPDFISRSNERQRWVSHLAEERQTEKVILRVQQQQRWLQQQQQKQIQRHGRLTGRRRTRPRLVERPTKIARGRCRILL
ncbi:unnamed protein product [Lampetra planeri]